MERTETFHKIRPRFSMNRPQTGQSVVFSTISITSVNNIIIYIFWHGDIKSYHMLMISRGPIFKYNLNQTRYALQHFDTGTSYSLNCNCYQVTVGVCKIFFKTGTSNSLRMRKLFKTGTSTSLIMQRLLKTGTSNSFSMK